MSGGHDRSSQLAAKRSTHHPGCGRDWNADFRGRLRIPRWNSRHRRAGVEATASMITRLLTVGVASLVLGTTSGAQVVLRPPTPVPTIVPASKTTGGCPGGNGIHISTTSGTLTDSASGVNTVISLDQSVDTTFVFDISRKTCTATNFAAAISLGLADESRGRYAICAGVTALMPSATLTINGVRGRVHFVASLKELNDALRRSPVQ
jgi:hypothetical protein